MRICQSFVLHQALEGIESAEQLCSDLEKTASLIDDQRHEISQRKEPNGFNYSPFPGIKFAFYHRESGETGNGKQAKQHDAKSLQRRIVIP